MKKKPWRFCFRYESERQRNKKKNTEFTSYEKHGNCYVVEKYMHIH